MIVTHRHPCVDSDIKERAGQCLANRALDNSCDTKTIQVTMHEVLDVFLIAFASLC